MTAFSYYSAGAQVTSTSSLMLTVPFPTSRASGDVFFLVCRGATATACTFGSPSGVGAEQIGTKVAATSGTSINPVSSMQVFWWVHGGSNSSVSVTATTSGYFDIKAQIFGYRGSGEASIVGTPADATGGDSTTFQGPSYSVGDSLITVINVTVQAGVSGTLVVDEARDWTSRATLTNSPAARLFDISGIPGTYASPTLSSGVSRAWLAKVWALSNPLGPVPADGWSVGQIKY